MKTKLLLALMLLGVLSQKATAAVEPNWGPADTLACHMVGPGIKYTKIIYPKLPLILWYTEVDLSNPYNKIEQVQSRHSVPDMLRWDVMTHYKENSRPGHKVKVAWNHDFFVYESGICIGMNISEGETTWNTWGRSLLAFTKDKKAEVFWPNNFQAKAIAPDNTEVVIEVFNASAAGIQGDAVYFNRMNATTLAADGRYIKVAPQAQWTVNGTPVPCKVLEISDSPLQTSATEHILFLRNTKRNIFDGHLAVGDILNISQKFNGAKWGTPPADILNAFHGYPSIAHDGVLHEGEYNDFENGREYEKSSHVMVGISKDKTKLYVLLNEMSEQSVAIDCIESTNWMLNRGAWDVVNFDSGGSSAIVVNEQMLNLPGRGSIRPVQDAMLAVSLAPEDNNIHHLTFSKPYIYPSTISLTPLRVMGFNQYDEVLQEDIKGCVFTCQPATLGYVDSNAILHTGSKATSGKVIAEKDGKRAEIIVNTRGAGNIYPRAKDIIIDGKRQYLIEVIGSTEVENFNLDPAAFQWVSSNPAVCVVEDGVLRGLSNGESILTATFDDISFNINVKTEMPEPQIVHDYFTNLASLDPQYGGVKNMVCNPAKLPIGWSDGATFKFDVTGSRAPYVRFGINKVLYALPDSLSFQMSDKAGIVSNISINYSDNLGNKYLRSFIPEAGKDSVYMISFTEDDKSIFEICKYPITVKTIQLIFQNSRQGTDYEIGLRNLVAYYPQGASSVDKIVDSKTNAPEIRLTVNPEAIKVSFDALKEERTSITMYSTTGGLIFKKEVNAQVGVNELIIDTKDLGCGFYLVTVANQHSVKSKKCIIR